jgi:hypothetical protein
MTQRDPFAHAVGRGEVEGNALEMGTPLQKTQCRHQLRVGACHAGQINQDPPPSDVQHPFTAAAEHLKDARVAQVAAGLDNP